jgi:DUF971 family protein
MKNNPTEIKLLQKSKLLYVTFEDGVRFELPCEYLRVFSPSAEVKGHGGQGGQLVLGKKDVNIVGIDPVGHYAIKLIFDDGHQTGIYSWDILYELGQNYQQNWQDYLAKLTSAGQNR